MFVERCQEPSGRHLNSTEPVFIASSNTALSTIVAAVAAALRHLRARGARGTMHCKVLQEVDAVGCSVGSLGRARRRKGAAVVDGEPCGERIGRV